MRKLAFIFVTVLLAACGDSGSGASDITKEEFVTKANEICAAGSAELEAAGEDIDAESMTEDELSEAIADIVIPEIREQISDIRDLGFPEDDADELDAIFDDAEQVLDELEDDPSKFLSDEDPFADVNERLSAYGLTECSDE